MTTNEAIRNPRPVKKLLADFSMLGGLLPLRLRCRPPDSSTSSAGPVGNLPDSACGTRLTFAPQARQNFAPSIGAAQFGQYTFVSSEKQFSVFSFQFSVFSFQFVFHRELKTGN
jgi:hypothetical protein